MAKKNNFDELDDFDDDLSVFDEDDRGGGDLRSLEEFEATVDDQMKILLSRKAEPAERVEAALWLGNSGAPKAITALRRVYEHEKDKKIRNAAKYALGQFKALDTAIERGEGEPVLDALEREENAVIRDLLEDIALGRTGAGGRSGGSPVMMILMGVLFVSLLGLVIGNALLLNTGEPGNRETVDPTPAGIDPSSPLGIALNEVNAMQQRAFDVQDDATELKRQYDAFQANQTPFDCSIIFKRPQTYIVPSPILTNFPDLNLDRIAGNLSSSVTTLSTIQSRYDLVCPPRSNEQTPVPAVARQPLPAEVTQASGDLQVVLDDMEAVLETIQGTRTQLIASATPTPAPTAEATPEATATPLPTIEPTATVSPVVVNRYLSDLYAILDAVSDRNGARTLLVQYWNDVASAGRTDGCRLPAPQIPENYTETIPADVLLVAPALQSAVEQLNIGLDLLRQGWGLFNTSCQNNTLGAQLPVAQEITRTVETTFSNAEDILNTIRTALRNR
ncbi:MAG: hypothetical protein SF029_04750 [bacterium]|nr:hypothetical protein [bacterium]